MNSGLDNKKEKEASHPKPTKSQVRTELHYYLANISETHWRKDKVESIRTIRQTFLRVLKIDNRKPVLVSCHTRDRLDEIVRRLGGRKTSVSGLIEIARCLLSNSKGSE